MAQPPLAKHSKKWPSAGFRRVVVQPHLLFAGDMESNTERAMRAVASRHLEQQWLITNVLGLDMTPDGDAGQLLTDTIVSRYEQSLGDIA